MSEIIRNVVLDEETYGIVRDVMKKRSFGKKGFSLSLRTIIREWSQADQERYRITEAGRSALRVPQETA